MKGNTWKAIRSSLLFLAVFALVVTAGMGYIAWSTKRTAQEAGEQVAETYLLRENALLQGHRLIVEAAQPRVVEMLQEGASHQEIRDWLRTYSAHLAQRDDTFITGVFVILDGEFYPPSGWVPPEDYDVRQRPWYQQIMAGNGSVAYSDIYVDAETKQPVITIALALGEDDVLGIDILVEQFAHLGLSEQLDPGHLQALYDRQGNLVSHRCDRDPEQCPHSQEYLMELYHQMESHSPSPSFSYVDSLGSHQAVYWSTSQSGWQAVTQISADWRSSGVSLMLFCIALLTAVYLVVIVRMVRSSQYIYRSARRGEGIIGALSHIYYEIFLVQLDRDTFQPIKLSPEVEEQLGAQRSYTALLHTLGELLQKGERPFPDQFSPQQLEQIMGQGLDNYSMDYSMDYRRPLEGKVQWVNAHLLYDVEGLSHNEVLLAFQKINYRKRRELRQRHLLEEAMYEAQAASQAKSSFLSNMSHEMRTPLNGIIGYTQLAASHRGDAAALWEYLEKISVSSRMLLELINNLLDMVKIEQGAMELHPEEMDVVRQVTEATEAFRPQLECAGKVLELSLAVEHPWIYGDTLRLTQILNNLLSNAGKFTQSGDRVSVTLTQLPAPEDRPHRAPYRLTVADTGVGMSKEFLLRLFTPFEQEQNFLQKKVTGTGLGMAILHRLVEDMEGTVEVDSTPGVGTTFTVTIPFRLATRPPTEQSTPPILQPPEPAVCSFPRGRVLLAEDNEINMEITRELLEMHGFQVTPAWDGQEAVEQFAASPPGHFRVILMDMKMPRMDGCEATRTIRAMDHPDAATIPIFAVTANAYVDDVAQVLQAGMNAHLSKPIDFQQLLSLLLF